jgi:hypothetical protein
VRDHLKGSARWTGFRQVQGGNSVTGIEIAVGCLVAWTWRKARKVGERADGEVDFVLDTAMGRVHEVIARKLSGNAELERLREEAETGQEQPSALTARRVTEAITAAAESDSSFSAELAEAVKQLEEAQHQAGSAVAGAYGLAVAGDVNLKGGDNSINAAVANIQGPVNIGNPSQPGQETR